MSTAKEILLNLMTVKAGTEIEVLKVWKEEIIDRCKKVVSESRYLTLNYTLEALEDLKKE